MWWSGSLSVEEAAVVKAIDALCEQHVTEAACARWERELAFPHEAMRALAASSWAALAVPAAYGGDGASAQHLAIVHRALARHSLAVSQAYYSLWVLGAEALSRLGSEDQRASWLPRIAAGDAMVAFALTEPDSGSDAAALRTRAARDGDDFIVNGQKLFITGAAVADRIVTVVRTGGGDRKHAGISLLMIDPASPGVSVRPLSKLGLKALDLCEVFLDDVRVPAHELLGRQDQAWTDLRAGLAMERLYLAAISVGAIDDVIGRVLAHAGNRRAFGHPIGGHQMIASKIARTRVAGDAAAALVREAATLVDVEDDTAAVAASVAKLFATEAYVTATREGVQVFGGYGFIDEYPIARHYRDAKYLEIGGGTSEIQTLVIARSMGLPV